MQQSSSHVTDDKELLHPTSWTETQNIWVCISSNVVISFPLGESYLEMSVKGGSIQLACRFNSCDVSLLTLQLKYSSNVFMCLI